MKARARMDQLHYREMTENLAKLIRDKKVHGRKIYLFGHCDATENLADALAEQGFLVSAILDNNVAKHGKRYKGIEIVRPEYVLSKTHENSMVCIAARAYEAMAEQLMRMGYKGRVYKLVDYNSYAEYSLSKETIIRRKQRAERGKGLLNKLEQKYPRHFRFLCPFSALGDIYIMMSYLPYFLKKRHIQICVIGVVGDACAQVVKLFGAYSVEKFSQQDIDEAIQAALYMADKRTFVPHQDRPYVINLHKALYIKRITLEQIYCCGVFGLPADTIPCKPEFFEEYPYLEEIQKDRAVVFSPYAKSVTAIAMDIWQQMICDYKKRGYQCFTSGADGEKPLPGTRLISASISQIRSIVERAGTFIGIRSGICDILREVKARKIALYPDYHYCDTKWRAIDIYRIDGWENIVVKDDFQWKKS